MIPEYGQCLPAKYSDLISVLSPSVLATGALSPVNNTSSFTAMELERIKTTPFHRLQRKELKVRKLLGRFHEDSQDDGDQTVRFGLVCVDTSIRLARRCKAGRPKATSKDDPKRN